MPIIDSLIKVLTVLKRKLKKNKSKKSKFSKKYVLPKKKKTTVQSKLNRKKVVKKNIKRSPQKFAKKKITTKKATAVKRIKKVIKKPAVNPSLSVKKKKSPSIKIIKKSEKLQILIGEVTHYFAKINVAVINICSKEMVVGQQIHLQGRLTDFKMKILSMQLESVDVKSASKGQMVGLKVAKPVRVGDKVYKV